MLSQLDLLARIAVVQSWTRTAGRPSVLEGRVGSGAGLSLNFEQDYAREKLSGQTRPGDRPRAVPSGVTPCMLATSAGQQL